MPRYLVFLITLLALSVVVCPSAFGLARSYDLSRPIPQDSDWPAGLANLLNSQKPVHAYYVNFQDMFFYSGDSSAFNAFIERYGRLEGIAHTLVLHCGKAETRDKFHGEKMESYDWHVLVDKISQQEYLVTVHLFLGGSVKLSEIEVPVNVKVTSGGEIEEFIKKHLSRSTPQRSGGGFGIYLPADEKINASDALKLKLDEIRLQEKPLLALEDFVCYSWEDHWFKLTPEALKKLPKPSPPENRLLRGIPFVVVADGKRIYLGAFWTSISSMSFPNPVIIADEMWLPYRRNWLTIDRAYPGATPEQSNDDPRNSPLLKSVMESAGKIEACKGIERPPSGGFSSTTQSASPE